MGTRDSRVDAYIEKSAPFAQPILAHLRAAVHEACPDVVTAPKKPLPVPPELKAALAQDKRARAAFEAFSPSHRNEYAEWIGEAKRDETRARRVAQALTWLRAGKHRNWKYERG